MLHRIVHNDPTCRVCRSTPGMVATAAPIPPPLPNPEHKRPTFGEPRGQRDGGPTGTHWYHGTGFDPSYDEDEHHDDPTYGGELHAPESYGGEYGERAEHHWNTDLGVHFTSLKHVAEEFAEKKGEAGHQRIAHATLHMANPIHFQDEEEFAHHAASWAHDYGHRFLPENDQAHKAFIHGHYSPDDDEDESSVEHYDEQEGKGRSYEYLHEKGPNDPLVREHISDIDKRGPKMGHSIDALEGWLGKHPDREQITEGYKNHLKLKGHDGITYGNSYEGPYRHKCAIAFDSTPVNIHHWEWLNEDHPGNKAREPQTQHHDDPNQLEFDYHSKHGKILINAVHRASGRRVGSLRARGDVVEQLEILRPYRGNGFAKQLVDEMRRRASGPAYYHGTTVENVSHILPASEHGGHVTFPHDTSRTHAYATTNEDDAWNYAEKAWHANDRGIPRVYRVEPMGHVEKDPQEDERGNWRSGVHDSDVRSPHGFKVLHEMPMPEHMGAPEEWR